MSAWTSQIDNHIVEPSSIKGLRNGEFPDDRLREVFDPDGNVVGRLAPEAARSWNAMVRAAAGDGVNLEPTSMADAYRPLVIQQRIFADRYRTTDQGNGSRVCAGKTWYKRQGVATAACPGTSNHGRGLAVDFARPTRTVLQWMEIHAKDFGWQWELSSEEWHVHYMPGDRIPQAVLDHEGDGWMGDPYDRGEVVGALHEILALQRSDHAAIADMAVAVLDPEGGLGALIKAERAAVLAAIEALDDSGGGLSKAEVIEAVKQAGREGTG